MNTVSRILAGRLPLFGMAGIVGLVAWTVGGLGGAVVVTVAIGLSIVLLPQLPLPVQMRFVGARPAAPGMLPGLQRILARLAGRAGLSRPPELYLITGAPNAFSVGGPRQSALAVSGSLMQLLSERELVAVMAHEIAHIAADDVRLMRFGDLLNRACHAVAIAGLLGASWMVLMHDVSVAPNWVYWALALAPTSMHLLQLALSRAREYAADYRAATLTGDPAGLAAALARIETAMRFSLGRAAGELTGMRGRPWLRTHPATRDRIRRLRELTRAA